MKRLGFYTFVSSIGSALEYYNFVTFMMLSGVLSELFFPHSKPIDALLYTLLIFSVAYFAAPLGAVMAIIGDKKGRKTVFLWAIILMTCATVGIGLMPTSSHLGFASTLMLILFRLVQGGSQGAELPGGITFITEHSDDKNRGLHCGLVFMGVGMGAMLSTLVNTMLTHYLSHQQILDFAWRIPFFIGGLLGIVGFVIRKKLEETPIFLAEQSSQVNMHWQSIKENYSTILTGLGMMLLPAAMVTFGLFVPNYLHQNFGYSASSPFAALLVSFLLSSLLLPVFGHLSDKVGRKKMYYFAQLLTMISLGPLFVILQFQNQVSLYAFNLIYHVLVVLMASCYPCLLAEIFPTEIRYTGVAISYMGAYCCVGLVPFFIMTVFKWTQEPSFAAVSVLIVCGLISLWCLSRLMPRKSLAFFSKQKLAPAP